MLKKILISLLLGSSVVIALLSCNGSSQNESETGSDLTQDLTSQLLVNEAAYIPPQCYTQTIDAQNQVHNPCFACHIPSEEPNYINDGDLQLGYTFAEYANTNHWTNLFKDRSQAVAAISDQEMLDYVRSSNYSNVEGEIILAKTLAQVPSGWDFNQDGDWDGFIPDTYLNFDPEGFDHHPDTDAYTGWRAFAYAPFLGTFWPTNGSTDDVLIRLPEPFRNDINGNFDLTIYKTNLAIVEAMIKRVDVALEEPYTENGTDLDKDGDAYGTASQVTYDWAPLQGIEMFYVGQARQAQDAGELHIAAGLYPEGTEFLHSVRYIDVDDQGETTLAARMKELRYARKTSWLTYSDLLDLILAEGKEKRDFPDRLRQVIGNVERGVSNDRGWIYQGFIEDRSGALRPQTYEESVFCVGCHGGIGATDDGIFAFSRKLGAEATNHGWYHWTQKGLSGQDEPLRSDQHYEYSFYLEQNGAGDEFRANAEVIDKFFDATGQIRNEELEILHDDITHLLSPSRERALTLNKAYRVLVEEQSFAYGRDATVTPPVNVHQSVTADQPTGVIEILSGP